MIKDNKILIGKSNQKEVYLLPNMMNRHGVIAGASGTGKTITVKVIAESLSELGVPTFIADVKGDLSGMVKSGDKSSIQSHLDELSLDYEMDSYPVHFFDVFRKYGMPFRIAMDEMDTILLSRILGLTDVQSGVLQIIFKVSEEMDLDIIDLKDLQSMCQYVGEHAQEYTVKYGNVSKQSVGAIQRRLLEFESQNGELLFGMPSFNINDLFNTKDSKGYMTIMECEELFKRPLLYSTVLLWLLDKLYNELPEVGDLDKPKLVFFFDEAHLLFKDIDSGIRDKILQIVKLIRSKGVGIFFISQATSDIDEEVLSQLSNRIQHSLRAYTPAEIKNLKTVASSFRENPEIDVNELLTNMKTGYALASCLLEDGSPSIVEHIKVLPPKSSMKAIEVSERTSMYQSDDLYIKL